jgi:tetratricopeptide (TPR) repeat protein
MRKLLLLLLFGFFGWCASGQSEARFAFVQSQYGVANWQPTKGYKYEVTRRIFQELLRTRGDIRQQAPTLVMNNGEQFVAWMDAGEVVVGLEEKAYDVCASMGPDSLNALAALLAHEITHYYEKHDWSRNFVNANKTLDAARRIEIINEGIKLETQADCLGGFLAFSAGYNVYNLMPQLLEQLYRAYGLPEVLPGYPDLKDRIEVSQNAMAQLLDLQTVFQTARFLTLLEDYNAAATYYQHILQTYQSREIYNNAGVNYALAALGYFNEAEMPYVLPLELDPNSRLGNLKNIQTDRLATCHALLRQAAENFDRAIGLDPSYPPAYLNKATVHLLVGEWEDAEFWLHKGQKKNEHAEPDPNFMVLEGILAALQKDTAQAQQLLTAASVSGSTLASINLAVLERRYRKPLVYDKQISTEELDQTTLDAFLAAPSVDQEIKVSNGIICGVKTLATSSVWLHYANDGQSYCAVHWTAPGSEASTRQGIGPGAAAARVAEVYGPPQRIVAETNGVIWIYQGYQLLFAFDQQGLVRSWGTYRQSDL